MRECLWTKEKKGAKKQKGGIWVNMTYFCVVEDVCGGIGYDLVWRCNGGAVQSNLSYFVVSDAWTQVLSRQENVIFGHCSCQFEIHRV